MRVRSAGREPERCMDIDHLAPGVRRRGFDGVHEGVVAEAILNDEPSRADDAGDRGARLETVGGRVGIAQNGCHLHEPAADLGDDVRILILRSDGDDRPWAVRAVGAQAARARAREESHRYTGGDTPTIRAEEPPAHLRYS